MFQPDMLLFKVLPCLSRYPMKGSSAAERHRDLKGRVMHGRSLGGNVLAIPGSHLRLQ